MPKIAQNCVHRPPRTHQIVNDGQPGAEPDEGGEVGVQPDQPLAFVGEMILEAIF
jgi:hypothetical protein